MGYFIAGAGVFMFGMLFGASIVRATYKDVLKGGEE